MKKITLTLKMLLFVALLATWSSCSKSDDNEIVGPTPVNPTPNTPDTPTPSEPDDPYMTVCEHVAEVAKNVDFYYDQCHSMAELNKYLEDIKKIEYVEDAYSTSNTLFVRIKDYGRIAYSYFPKKNSSETSQARHSIMKKLKKQIKANQNTSHPTLSTPKIAIASQVQFDEDVSDREAFIDFTRDMFELFNFDVSKNVIAPKVDFFNDQIFDYDIVYLLTHGGYDPVQGDHFFLTSEYPNENNHELNGKDLYESQYKNISTDEVFWDKHEEIRRGQTISLWYAVVSENWIKNSNKHFKNQNNAIVFNGCCLSLCGPNPETKDSISNQVAEIFIDKGAGIYMGYDESNFVGDFAGVFFLHKLFSGMSIERAYEDLPYILKHDFNTEVDEKGKKRSYWADLKLYPPNSNFSKTCIWSPFFNIESSYYVSSNKDGIKLSGNAYYSDTYFPKYGTKTVSSIISNNSPIRYGFYISENQNLKDAKEICQLGVGSDGFNQYGYDGEYYWVSFDYSIADNQVKPKTNYNYWAYFFDGKDYYFSDMGTFTSPAKSNSSGSGELPNVPGSDL